MGAALSVSFAAASLREGGMGAALSVSFAATSLGEGGTIPQSALRLTAPFAQGSLYAGAAERPG